jgi:alanine racemase
MDRRAFLKAWTAASGSFLLPGVMPMTASARGDLASLRPVGPLAEVGAAAGTCQGNDACVTIHPEVFASNIRHLQQDVGPDVKLCLVMKSDAYAHGIANLMPEALAAEPAYIGLTGNRDIRVALSAMDDLGQRATILRIAPATSFEAAESMLGNWPVEELVGSVQQAEMLSRTRRLTAAQTDREVAVPVHLNIDTGMGRMGFVRTDDVKRAMELPGIEVRGVMTHYANAYDLERGRELTKRQLDRFDAALAELDLPDDVIVHTANSGATLSFPWARRDMVRVGGALYGDIPTAMNPDDRYRQVMAAFISSVVWVMEVPPNTSVGYDGVYHTPKGRDSTLATVKLGYNNGLPSWAYERHTQVLIRGRRFPVVGKTSMNMVVVDVTGQDPDDKVRLGDEVVIFGRQGGERIRWEELEDTIGVATGEISLTIGKSNPRIVVRGGS